MNLIVELQLGDVLGVATAQMNIGDLCKVLGMPNETETAEQTSSVATAMATNEDRADQTPFNALRVRRQSMEQLSLIQVRHYTPVRLLHIETFPQIDHL